jgi:hypothetical protein
MKAKSYKDLKIEDIEESQGYIYYTWSNSDSTTIYNKTQNKIKCNCINGSLAGVNDKQVCYHKTRVLVELYKQKRLMIN